MWRQRSRMPSCPDTPRLDGKLALVTGGNGGIGYQTIRGLMRRGADVVMASRNQEKAGQACQRLRDELGASPAVDNVTCDLGDLDSVAACVADTIRVLGRRSVDVFIANAGISPKAHRLSKQGHESTFATNVLGHHLLTRLLQDAGRLKDSRVVILTGDIYCLVSECTPDYKFSGSLGGLLAYARSKLGNLWLARELAARASDLSAFVVHPGAVATDLVVDAAGLFGRIGRRIMLTSEEGAQMSLICATQDGLENGGYYHNTLGLMRLSPGDPGADRRKAAALWDTCEHLCRGHLSAS
jgi:NAD(P)-dependent dehydrogenase (short-subunit alcohol dehydrogenase family)